MIKRKNLPINERHLKQIYLCSSAVIHPAIYAYCLYMTTLIILLQHLLQVRSLVEYLSCKLRVGDNLPVSVVLQGTGTDIQPLAHFLSCEEKFTAKSRLCVCTTSTIRLPTPLNAETTNCISSVSMFKSLAVSIISICF